MIKSGKRVSLEYTVFLEDGTQVDTNVGDDPLTFVCAQTQVFPRWSKRSMPQSRRYKTSFSEG